MEFQQVLSRLLTESLPGEKAHERMAPLNRPISSKALQAAINVRESAVAVMLFPVDQKICCTLIQRPQYEGNHGGQISFPGGKREITDENLRHTAIRECFEEVGVDLSSAEFLGKLTSVYVPISNFHVEPFVFYYPDVPTFIPDSREVESVWYISTEALLDETVVSKMDVPMSSGFVLRDVPCFLIDGRQIWGATALILNELKALLRLMEV